MSAGPASSLPSQPEPGALKWVVTGLTLFVFAAVAVVLYAMPGRTAPGAPGPLATVNAVLNGAATLFLLAGFYFIKRRAFPAHRACMIAAFSISSLFLVTYLLHHASVGTVKFQGTGPVRTLYFSLLIPHIVLAGPVVPLALYTLYRGATQRFAAHRKIARITLPVWLFVSASGVIVYFMLYHLPI
jgi:putative membrane protein